MEGNNTRQLEKIFKALANRRRLAILHFLAKEKELSVAEIARRIKLSFTSTSKHLAILRQLDIVDRRQEGLTVHYSLADPFPHLIKQFLPIISNSRE